MKRILVLFIFFIAAFKGFAVDVSYGGIKFRSNSFTNTGSIYQSSDSTFLGYDSASTFKPLLFIRGKLHIDPLQFPFFQVGLGTGYQIYAKVGIASTQYQLLDSSNVSNAWTYLSTSAFFDPINGFPISMSSLPTITFASIKFKPTKIFFDNKPPQVGTNASILGLQGVFMLPVDSGSSFGIINSGTQKLYITDSGNYSPSFVSNQFTPAYFKLNKLQLNNTGDLSASYNASLKSFSLYGSIYGYIPDDSIPAPGDSLKINIGTSAAPGLVVSNGTMSDLSGKVVQNFKLKSFLIDPDTLSFNYQSSSKKYVAWGGLTYLLGPDSMPSILGNSSSPGILISDGKLASLSSTITKNIRLKSLTIDPDTLTIGYTGSKSQYSVYGPLKLIIGKDSLAANLGFANSPGMIMKNGSLSSFSASITQNVKLKKLKIDPDTLTFVYTPDKNQFNMFGGLTVIYGLDSLYGNLGTKSAPGMVSKNDTIRNFDMYISGNIRIRKLAIDPDTLSFSYSSSDDSFKSFGNVSFLVGSDTILANLGNAINPGMVVSNDTLRSFTASITSTFRIDSLQINPDSLTFSYQKATDSYSGYGNLNLTLKKDTIRASLGTATNPGLSIVNGSFQYFRTSISANFELDSLQIDPDSLTFEYTSLSDQFNSYGGVKLLLKTDTVFTDTIYATFGNAASPGLIVNAGAVQQLRAGVTANFRYDSLSFDPDTLTVWYTKDSLGHYSIYGNAKMITENDTIFAQLGSFAKPGIVLSGGALKSFNGAVTGNFKLKNTQFDPDTLRFIFDSDQDYFACYGGLNVLLKQDTVYSDTIAAFLGNDQNPGLLINGGKLISINGGITGNFRIDSLAIDPDSLLFTYNSDSAQFEINGGISLLLEGDTLQAQMGDSINPGIVLRNSQLQALNTTLNGRLKIKKLNILTDTLNINYDRASEQFVSFGTIRILNRTDSVHVDTILTQLGNKLNPGMLINSGQLNKFSAAITAKFSIDSMEIDPDMFTLSYNRALDKYSAFGGLTVLLPGDTIIANMGDSLNPGMAFTNGSLSNLNITTTGNFKLKTIQLDPDTFNISYNRDSSYFAAYGKLKILSKSDTIQTIWGTAAHPGLQINNGSLTSLNAVITNKFKIDSTTFAPYDTLTMFYDGASESFGIYGGIQVYADADTLTANLGDIDNPGIALNNGSVQSINMQITDKFTIHKMQFQPDSLALVYNRDSSIYEIYGSAKVITKKDTIFASLGDKDHPGLLVKKGKLLSLNAGITGNFKIDSLQFDPDTLTLTYNADLDRFGMYGGFRVYYDSDTIRANFGNVTSPGILFANGQISQLNARVSGNFKVRKMEIFPDSLTFQYNRDSSLFSLFGSVTALVKKDSIHHDSIGLWLGNSSSPGFLIKNGKLQQLNAAITDSFDLKGVNFNPKNFGLSLNIPQSTYGFFGTLNVLMVKDSVTRDSFDVSMGTQQQPGMVFKNGSLNSVNASVTAAFKLRGLSVSPQNLTFLYDSASAQFKMYGALTLGYSGEYMNVKMGKQNPDNTWIPGLAIDTKTGDLESLYFSTTDTFRIKKLLIAPTDVTLIYDRDSAFFEMYGSALVKLDSNKIAVTMGNALNPGLVIDSGEVRNVDFGVTADFKIGGFEIKPQDLTFQYSKLDNRWEMYGDIEFALEKDTITAILGTETNPGILVQNGILTQLNIAVNSDIKVAKLDVKTDSLGVKYVRTVKPSGGVTETFYMHGDLSLSELWSAKVDLNTPQNPYGLIISIDSAGNKSLEIDGISAELDHASIGGITIDQLKVTFNKIGNGDYDIEAGGTVSFPAGFQLAGDLNFEDNNGTFQLHSIALDYTATGDNQGIELVASIAITELGGSLVYTSIPAGCITQNLSPDSVSILAYYPIIGPIYKHNQRKVLTTTVCTPEVDNFTLGARIALDVGGQLNLLGTEVQLVRSVGNVTLTKDYLDINDTIVLGAYKSGTDGWKSVVTGGFADLYLNWTEGVYKFTGDLKYPPGLGFVDISAAMLYKTTGLIDANVKVSLIMPDWVPIEGGKSFGDIDGYLRYAKYDPNGSSVGGWVDYPWISCGWTGCSFVTHEVGASYNFGSGKTSLMGTSDVANIQTTLTNDGLGKAGGSYNNLIASSKFSLDGNSNRVIVKVIPSQRLDLFAKVFDLSFERGHLSVIGPMGTQSKLHFYFTPPGESNPIILDNLSSLDSAMHDSISHLSILIENDGQYGNEPLTPGEYTVLLTVDSGLVSKNFSIKTQALQIYPKPETRIVLPSSIPTVKLGQKLGLELATQLYITHDTLTPKVSLYYDDDSLGYDGHLFGTYPIKPNQPFKLDFSPHVDSMVVRYDTIFVGGNPVVKKIKRPVFEPSKKVYLYSKVEDGVNIHVNSDYTKPITFTYQPSPSILVVGGNEHQLNSLTDSIHIEVKADFTGLNKNRYKIDVYYDLDSNAKTGAPIKNLQNMSANQANYLGGWFKPPFKHLKGIERVFFYAVVTDTINGNMFKSYNSSPYLFGNNLHLKFVYNDPNSTPATGVHIATDANGNDTLDGEEYAHKTDRKGMINMNINTPEVDIVVKVGKQWLQYNSPSMINHLIKVDPINATVQTIKLNYPGIRGVIKDTLGNTHAGFKVYADVNNNGVFDQGLDVISDFTNHLGEFTLLNVFGKNIPIRVFMNNTRYKTYSVSEQPMNFDAQHFYNLIVQVK